MITGRSFIDIFGGCGGLSLGLMQAGWRGLFAIEADKLAFETLKANLVDGFGSLSVRLASMAQEGALRGL